MVVDLRYGLHTDLVQEAIDFASGLGLLFAVGGEEETADAVVTNCLPRALAADSDLSLFDLRQTSIADFIWTSENHGRTDLDALEGLVRQVFAEVSYRRHLRQLSNHVAELLSEQGLAADPRAAALVIVDVAEADLMYCALNRACNGLTNNFWETMFRLYSNGMWPCGLVDPEARPGKLLAYRRNS